LGKIWKIWGRSHILIILNSLGGHLKHSVSPSESFGGALISFAGKGERGRPCFQTEVGDACGRFDGGRQEEGKAEDHLIEDPERRQEKFPFPDVQFKPHFSWSIDMLEGRESASPGKQQSPQHHIGFDCLLLEL
jgi:hypothetical protein